MTATHDRAALLDAIALPSLQQQTHPNFEWIVVNDGSDLNTRDLIANAPLPCSVRYLEMPHPKVGFGLCHARNLGLAAATGDLVAYLDDDNAIVPEFVEATCRFFQQHPTVMCSMTQQWRRRDQVAGNRPIRSGLPFVAPSATAKVEDLLTQRELFDSNGFTHRRAFAPQWNPSYRIFADYEYFLQCLTGWGRSSFQLHAAVLVKYVQRSDGIIGRSSFHDWAIELGQILGSIEDYPVLEPDEVRQLHVQVQRWQTATAPNRAIPAFVALPLDDQPC